MTNTHPIDREKLRTAGQMHLMQFVDELNADELDQLAQQIEAIDFDELTKLVQQDVDAVNWEQLAARAEPPPAIRLGESSQRPFTSQDARRCGEDALRANKVGVLLVAGGQGTRLGFAPPKGMYPIGPVSQRTLFQMHCDRLLAVMKRYHASIPLYVMTSPATDDETRAYFESQQRCGLAEDQLKIFCQGTMPAVDSEGKILMASKSQLALSPDGHGGLLTALDRHACLADARQRGIQYLFYAQVDNPLVQLCDPDLIGYHILSGSQMTTQVVKKRFAKEKVGNVVAIDGKVQIIEYSDLPDKYAEQTTEDGALKLWAGNIAVHVFDVDFLSSVVESSSGLPFHRAHKTVSYVDQRGQLIEPQQPNAIKFERFIFDLLPMASSAFVVEGDAAEIFAPVKNADGAPVDTPQHCRQAICRLHRSWLENAGATLADGISIEIHPDWALDAQEVRASCPRRSNFRRTPICVSVPAWEGRLTYKSKATLVCRIRVKTENDTGNARNHVWDGGTMAGALTGTRARAIRRRLTGSPRSRNQACWGQDQSVWRPIGRNSASGDRLPVQLLGVTPLKPAAQNWHLMECLPVERLDRKVQQAASPLNGRNRVLQ